MNQFREILLFFSPGYFSVSACLLKLCWKLEALHKLWWYIARQCMVVHLQPQICIYLQFTVFIAFRFYSLLVSNLQWFLVTYLFFFLLWALRSEWLESGFLSFLSLYSVREFHFLWGTASMLRKIWLSILPFCS